MKLIIDIPEEDIKVINEHNFEWGYCVTNLFNAVKHGVSLNTIKGEIKEIPTRSMSTGKQYEMGFMSAINKVMWVVDKYLKG